MAALEAYRCTEAEDGVTTGAGQGASPTGRLARGGAIPLYYQIYLTLRDEILRGERPFGSRIPTEMKLGETYGVSRITARRALDDLSAQGLVERRRRLGTQVAYRAPRPPIEAGMDHALESLIAFGATTDVRVLSFGMEYPGPQLCERLGLGANQPTLRAVRLRLSGGDPLGVVTSDLPLDHLPPAVAGAVSKEALARRPLLAILKDAGVVFGSATQTVEAVLATPELATMLQVDPQAAILRIERLVRDEEGRPILLTSAAYRADNYRLTMEMDEGGRLSPEYG